METADIQNRSWRWTGTRSRRLTLKSAAQKLRSVAGPGNLDWVNWTGFHSRSWARGLHSLDLSEVPSVFVPYKNKNIR